MKDTMNRRPRQRQFHAAVEPLAPRNLPSSVAPVLAIGTALIDANGDRSYMLRDFQGVERLTPVLPDGTLSADQTLMPYLAPPTATADPGLA